MRKNLYRIILFALLILNSVYCASQPKYTTANLNVRTGPGTNYEVISVIPKGTVISQSDDCDCEWILVEYDKKIGYISAKYVSAASPQTVGVNKKSDEAQSQDLIKYYTNSAGVKVQSPTIYSSVPKGATALCRDGTYSFSKSRKGTCSHHGGVAKWL